MRSTKLKVLGGLSVAFLAGMVAAADGPTVPASAAANAVAADTAHLNKLLELSKTKKVGGRMAATAALLAVTTNSQLEGKDAGKMAGLRAGAVKVAEAVAKKDAKGIEASIKGLASPAASDDKKAADIPTIIKMTKVDLNGAMELYAGAPAGGMNIEKDLRELKKTVKNVADAELLATRTAYLSDLTLHLPNDKAASKKKDWDDLTAETKKLAVDLATEAGKADKADKKKLSAIASKLDGSCTNCHNKFRDD